MAASAVNPDFRRIFGLTAYAKKQKARTHPGF